MNPPLNDHIKDHHILVILAIAEAWDVLKNMLYHKKDLNDSVVINQVQIADNLLAQANKISLEEDVSDLKPNADYAKRHLLTGNVFRKKDGGGGWDIYYDNKLIELQDSKGLEYIHYLLSNPDQDIPVIQLERVIAGNMSKKHKNLSKGQLIDEGLTISPSDTAGNIIDNNAIQEYKNRIKELEKKLEDAEELGNDDDAAKISDDIEQILRNLKEGSSKYKFGGQANKARKAVSNNIKNSMDKIKKEHLSLWKHLDRSINSGAMFSYTPENHTPWML